jgi:hypothetical protein
LVAAAVPATSPAPDDARTNGCTRSASALPADSTIVNPAVTKALVIFIILTLHIFSVRNVNAVIYLQKYIVTSNNRKKVKKVKKNEKEKGVGDICE